MKIPARILKRVAGPLLASAALSCSSPAPVENIRPISAVTPAAVVSVPEVPDPVAYDALAEAERNARADAVLASSEVTRDQRIETQEAEERRRARASVISARNLDLVYAACGRG